MLYYLTVGPDTELLVSPMKHIAIKGEVNVLRYLSRLGPPAFNYELNVDPATSARLDGVLDACYTLARCRTIKEQQLVIRDLGGYLGKAQFMAGGNGISIADVAVWSVLRQIDAQLQRDMSSNMKQWLHHCSQLLGCGKLYDSLTLVKPFYQGADKSLARPGRKQATATKLFRRLSIQPGLRGSSDLRVRCKMATFNCFSLGSG